MANCIGTAPPYTIDGSVQIAYDLDLECAGVGGLVNVTGDLSSPATVPIFDPPGGQQDWDVRILGGVQIDSGSRVATIRFGSPNGSLDNSGTIINSDEGDVIVFEGFFGTVTNSGEINQTGTSGFGDAIYLNMGGRVVNETGGLIRSAGDQAIFIEIGDGFVINQSNGEIIGHRQAVLVDSGTGEITNAGLIRSENQAAIQLENGGRVDNLSGGMITGSDEAIRIAGGRGTVTNAGTLAGGGGTAILFENTIPTGDTLEIQPGSVINGNVLAGDGDDTLRLGGSGEEAFDLSDIGGQYQDFEIFEITGGDWTTTGTTTEAFIVSGGTLKGTGSFGGLTFNAGSTVAPGNSIGTITVTGDVTFDPGTVFDVEIAADGTNDLIEAGGQANLNGNGQVNPILVDPVAAYTDGQTYTILTAAGGVNGRFAGINNTAALLVYTLRHDANTVFLNLAPIDERFELFATTFNQSQVAGALSRYDFSVAADSIALLDALVGLNADELAAAYDSMTGEVYASGRSMGANSGGQFTNLLMSNVQGLNAAITTAPLGYAATGAELSVDQFTRRYAANAPPLAMIGDMPAADPVLSAWFGGFGASAEVDGDDNASQWRANSWGLGAGIETDLSWHTGMPATVGLGFGYSKTDGGLNARDQALDIESWHVGIYGQAGATPLQRGLNVRAAASYAYQDYDAARQIRFGGIDQTARADYDGGVVSGIIEARYQIPVAFDFGTAVFSPLVRAQLDHAWTGAFTETGAGAVNLAVASGSYTAGSVAIGATIGGDYLFGDVRAKPSLTIAYDRLIGSDTPQATLSFANSPTAFAVRGPEESRDRLRLGAGTALDFNDRVSLNLASDALLSSDHTEFSGQASLKIAF